MKRLLFFLILFPALLVSQSAHFDENLPVHSAPDRTYDVKSYLLNVTLDYPERKISGAATIVLNPLNDGLSEVALDSAELQIHSVEANGRPVEYRLDGEKLIAGLGRTYRAADTITLKVLYEGHPRKGLYWVGGDPAYPDKPMQIWSQGEDEDSHFWFPCYDFPNDKATTETYFTVKKPFTAVSNGRLVEVQDRGMNRTFHWKMDVPHSTYLTSVAVGDFEEYKEKAGDVSVEYYVPRGTGRDTTLRAFGRTPDMLRFFSQRIGIPYPYNKYAQITVADFPFGGMENITATTQNLEILHDTRDEQGRRNQGTVAHELAHQWWGDLVTCADWSHIWLNEGFATYFAALYTRKWLGDDEFRDELYHSALQYFDEDRRYRRPLVSAKYGIPIDLFDQTTYNKGSRVLGMIHYVLGEEAFFKAIHHYGRKFAQQNVTSDDLRRAIYESTGKNLDRFFDQWLYRAGYPEYDVGWTWSAGQAEVTVRQTQKVDGQTPLFEMPVVVDFTLPDGQILKFTIQVARAEETFRFPVPLKPAMVRFDPGDHILKKLNFRKDRSELVFQASHDSDVIGRIRAIDALGSLGPDRDTEMVLVRAAESDGFQGVRAAAIAALGRIRGNRALGARIPPPAALAQTSKQQ